VEGEMGMANEDDMVFCGACVKEGAPDRQWILETLPLEKMLEKFGALKFLYQGNLMDVELD
jgi:hypothetical protein